MITIKFTGKRFKIYSDLRIRCLDDCSEELLSHVKFFITSVYETMEKGPEHGFPVSNLANILSEKGIEVVNYKDYELENSKEDVVYQYNESDVCDNCGSKMKIMSLPKMKFLQKGLLCPKCKKHNLKYIKVLDEVWT